MRKLNFVVFAIIFLSSMVFAGTYSGGLGTSGSPFKIENIDDLEELQNTSGDWGAFFNQTADINAGATSTWDSNRGLSPIGNTTTKFTGEYNGQGHIIDSLYINRPTTSYVGLFGYVNGGKIYAIGITNVNVSGDGRVGGLVGANYNSSTISNSYTTGIVDGDNNYVGGLVGLNISSSIVENSYSSVAVSGANNYVGGLIGYNISSSTVENSYSTGTVSGVASVGGLVGDNSAIVTNSFWDMETSQESSSAGGTGKTTAEMKCIFTYTDTSYIVSAGLDSAWDFVTNPNDDEKNNNYWDINNDYPLLSWQSEANLKILNGSGTSSDPYQVNNLCDLALVSNNTYYWIRSILQTADINAGATRHWDSGSGFLSIGDRYNQNFIGEYNGHGFIIDSLYINRSGTDYVGLFGYVNASDIDSVALTNMNIIGNERVGGLAGQIYSSTVDGSYSTGEVSGAKYIGGLVGYNHHSSVVTNSYCTASVNSTVESAGGLVGYSYDGSSINNSYSTGIVTGVKQVAGFLGVNNSSTVSNSYSTGSATGSDAVVGGLVGYNNNSSTVENSYSTGAVYAGGNSVGGIVGLNYVATISNSYSTGAVDGGASNIGGLVGADISGTTTNSFWNTETSNQSSSDGGTGKTTAEMTNLDISTNCFYQNTWDYIEKTTNGTEDIWNQGNSRNNGYPYFDWQYPEDNLGLRSMIDINIKIYLEGAYK